MPKPNKTMRKAIGLFLFLWSFGVSAEDSEQTPKNPHPNISKAPPVEAVPRKGWSFSDFESVPVLSGGRLKPMSSYANEVVLYVTSSRSYSGWNNSELLLSWMIHPQYWFQQKLFKVGHQDTRRQLLLSQDQTRFSAAELMSNSTVVQYMRAQETQSPAPDDKKLPAREQDLKRTLQGLLLFDRILRGIAWPIVPTDPPKEWEPFFIHPNEVPSQSPEAGEIRKTFGEVIKGYYQKHQGVFEGAASRLRESIQASVRNWDDSTASKLKTEVHYNRFRPFLWTWIVYLLAAIGWIFSIVSEDRRRWFVRSSLVATLVASAILIYGFALRVIIAGRPPVSNMYETVVWVGFGVMVFGGIVFALHRDKIILAICCSLTAFILMTADAAPAVLDPNIHPLVPVLRSNLWLLIHVLTITISYAAFALALGISNVTLFHFFKGHQSQDRKKKIQYLNQLNYRALQFGVVLVAAGTILGGVWADYSWGRFWGWDPKEVWALIVLLVYIAILHGRFAGWVGPFGFAAMSVLGFLSVIMAWYGVNFVLGAGLHSYGFSTGGTPYVVGFCLIQTLYVVAMGTPYWLSRRAKSSG